MFTKKAEILNGCFVLVLIEKKNKANQQTTRSNFLGKATF